MEDRITSGLYLELGDVDPDRYAQHRAPELLARPGVDRVTWWANNVPGRGELPMLVPDGTLLGVAEVDDRFVAPEPLPRTTARLFRHHPRPSQGILTGGPTTGLLVVWISPSAPEHAQALRDWGDFVHIRHIAAASSPASPTSPRTATPPGTTRTSCTSTSSTPRTPRPPTWGWPATWPGTSGGRAPRRSHEWADWEAARGPGRLLQHLPPARRLSPARRTAGRRTARHRTARHRGLTGHGLRPGRQAASARHAHHAEPSRAHERHGLRRDDPAARGPRGGQRRQRHPGGGPHRRRRGVLLGRGPRGRRGHPQHRRAHAHDDRPALDGAARRRHPGAAQDAPAGHRGRERAGHRRWLLPRRRLRHPRCLARRLLPRRGGQQRPHLERARPQLPAAPGGGLVARLRHHAHRSRRRRGGGGPHRARVAGGAAATSSSTPPTRSPSASSASPGWASSSPSACCGRASTRAACTATWTTRAPPSCTFGSPPRTSRRPCGPGANGGRRTSATDGATQRHKPR